MARAFGAERTQAHNRFDQDDVAIRLYLDDRSAVTEFAGLEVTTCRVMSR